jgi:hypothetical protein
MPCWTGSAAPPWPISSAPPLRLWWRTRSTASYLYDLTSTYFEGLAVANDKAQRGYSRDHRPDCKQVVIGLVVKFRIARQHVAVQQFALTGEGVFELMGELEPVFAWSGG